MKHKNIGPFLAFDKSWFRKHQGILLWLLNTSGIRRLSRWILRIRPWDCPTHEHIVSIGPSCFTYGLKRLNGNLVEVTTDFRTHPKFAKRVYFALRPVWWMLHAWDWAIADRFIPELSFGFTDLTVYPAAGANSPVDGHIRSYDYSWSAARVSEANAITPDPTLAFDYIVKGDFQAGPNIYNIGRSAFLFNTAALTSGASISAAIFSTYPQGYSGTDETTYPANLSLVASNPASNANLATTDFNDFGTTKFADSDVLLSNYTGAAYIPMTLNAAGIAAISKTAITKLGIRPSNDFSDSTIPTALSFAYGYFADEAGTGKDPKLVVTYTVAAIDTGKMFFSLM